ncbi:hypothetical protein GCM10027034_38640 [Ramlibacter solisilvae]|uniref:Methyltransferase FkbM domain-containing protein n=1 Tax=Ramlibacter tataouinensis TaxID=94132 RepID=A0A127JU68_9BURK|nr:FkbM family methyltransferase [Ramlibacter tataouinensis]AMO23598.1 hypothetical protein UC35_12745 [Ramlibacter tataouinensis]
MSANLRSWLRRARSAGSTFEKIDPGAPAPAPLTGPALFKVVFGREPTASQLKVLTHLGQEHGLSQEQRFRRVIAAFDQQELKTGLTVRWGEPDLGTVLVEGVRIRIDKADVSVSAPLAAGVYERHMIDFFRRVLRPGMHVIDAGANIGLYSLLAARLVGSQGKVWSFEPNSENCRLLLLSATENGLADIIALQPVALGDHRGFTYFTSALGSNGGVLERAKQSLTHPSCKIVPLTRLDDFGIERVDLMKMDVEGAEPLLVQGGVQTIERCRPVVVAEFSCEMISRISHVAGADFLRFFQSRDYEVMLMNRKASKLVPIADIDGFAQEFEGTGRIEDLVLRPREKTLD